MNKEKFPEYSNLLKASKEEKSILLDRADRAWEDKVAEKLLFDNWTREDLPEGFRYKFFNEKGYTIALKLLKK